MGIIIENDANIELVKDEVFQAKNGDKVYEAVFFVKDLDRGLCLLRTLYENPSEIEKAQLELKTAIKDWADEKRKLKQIAQKG